MQNITKKALTAGSYVATSTLFTGVIAALFLLTGVSTAYADTTYVVDASSPNGSCGTFCQQLEAYLNGGGNLNSATNGASGSASENSNGNSSNPYFSSANGNAANSGYESDSNGSNMQYGNDQAGSESENGSAAESSDYPNMVYTYYQNPNPNGTSSGTSEDGNQADGYGSNSQYASNSADSGYNYTAYPSEMYVYYPENGSSTVGSYDQNANAYNSYGASNSSASGTGFTRTS